MAVAIAPKNLRVYRDLVRLIWKYAGEDVVKRSRLDQHLKGDAESIDAGGSPAELARDLEKLGPAYVKIGQLLSTQLNVLSPPYVEALTRLQDHVEPFAFEQVREIVEQEFGEPVESLYRSFEPEPIAAASLAQVHRAELRDGRTVAVKVQRPRARHQIDEHMDALRHVAQLLDGVYGQRYAFGEMLAHTHKLLERELDFQQEANNARLIAEVLRDRDRLVVPLPVPDLVSRRVHTMQFIKGEKITAVDRGRIRSADGPQLAETLFHAYLEQILIHGVFHADPHPGNVLLMEDGRLGLIDMGMVERIAPRMRENLVQLVLAIVNGEGEQAADVAMKIGTPTREYNHRGFTRDVSDLVMTHRMADVEGLRLGQVMLEIASACGEHRLRLPPLVATIGKTMLNLDQIGQVLDPKFNPRDSVDRHKDHIIEQNALGAIRLDQLVAGSVELKQLIQDTPRRINMILDGLSRPDVGFKIDAIDEHRLLSGLEKIANRITHGLVIAAMFIAGAMLVHIEVWYVQVIAWAMILIALGAVGAVLVVMFINRDSDK